MKKIFPKFTKFEWGLWISSLIVMTLGFLIAKQGVLHYLASLIGVTALIFNAKGHVIGPILCLFFSALYGIISLQNKYYGEMLTYLGMSAPMAVFSIISWLKHPHQESAEVEVGALSKKQKIGIAIFSVVITVLFYFLLQSLGTASLWVSTVSVATSFLAASLTFFRSPYYAVGYVLNDIVLIVLWIIACKNDLSNLIMVACFLMFLLSDGYAFFNWQRIKKRQAREKKEAQETNLT